MELRVPGTRRERRPHNRALRRPKSGLFLLLGSSTTALLLGACGGGSGSSSSSTSPAAVPAAPAPSSASGCGTATAPGSTTVPVTIDNRRRSVIVHVPSGYVGSTKVPLVLNMHGSGSTASAQERFTGMDTTADTSGFIVAYPQALIVAGSGFDWNVPGEPLVGGKATPSGAANDVTFLTQLVGILEQRYCIDGARVYATGFSGGARTASQLACDAASTFAAVAPVSGLRHPTPCPATRPVPVIAFHGTADPVDPYNGHGQAYWTYSVPQAAQGWASQNRCSPAATTSQPDAGVTLTQYNGCAGGATVELNSVSGEGHEWPDGPPLPSSLTRTLGPQSSVINADSAMWAFFVAHMAQ